MDQNTLDDIATRIAAAADAFTSGFGPSPAQRADAASVLRDLLAGAAQHGVKFADFDAVADFPRLAIQLVMARDEER